jgi:hypothetical protein
MSKVFAIAHYGTLFRAIYTGLGVSKLTLTSERITHAAEVSILSPTHSLQNIRGMSYFLLTDLSSSTTSIQEFRTSSLSALASFLSLSSLVVSSRETSTKRTSSSPLLTSLLLYAAWAVSFCLQQAAALTRLSRLASMQSAMQT